MRSGVSMSECVRRGVRFVLVVWLSLAGGDAFLVGRCSAQVDSTQEERAPSLLAGGQGRYVHRLTLYDHDGVAISPEDDEPQPYSPRKTCGKCHPYDSIAQGWHFHAGTRAQPNDSDRAGEPWIWTDGITGTQLPLSERSGERRRPGVRSPASVGLNHWDATLRFGRHAPSGETIPGEATDPDFSRWEISGSLEIDCLVCHASAAAPYDPAEIHRQIERQNFRWSATAAFGLAVIQGNARDVPDDFDPMDGPDPDNPGASLPRTIYQASRFDANDRVFFDVTRRPDSSRCAFCHSADVAPAQPSETPSRWPHETDVHLSAGLECTDCHSNEIDHDIVRGIPGEGSPDRPEADRYNCRGCHLGDSEGPSLSGNALSGNFGAPRPAHSGFPALHFERLACTTCHSGSHPERWDEGVVRVQTSLAHGLGLASKERRPSDLPAIVEPVFRRDAQGRVRPERAFWPSYWAIRDSAGQLTPVSVSRLSEVSERIAARRKKGADEGTIDREPSRASARPSDGQLVEIYRELLDRVLVDNAQVKSTDAELIYIGQGSITEFRGSDSVVGVSRPPATPAEVEAVQPYGWPIAHPVRPAAQSLGSGGCNDCHRSDSILFGGTIVPPSAPNSSTELDQIDQWGYDRTLAATWSNALRVRDIAAGLGWLATAVLGLLFLTYSIRAVSAIARRMGGAES